MTATLRPSSRGPDVVALQTALAAEGLDPGPADGIYDPRTAAAVRAYQLAHHHYLAVDGVAGPATLAALGLAPAPITDADEPCRHGLAPDRCSARCECGHRCPAHGDGEVTRCTVGGCPCAAWTPAPAPHAEDHPIPRPPTGWIVGVDTSAAQGILDVPALQAAGVAFLIAKATDGERTIDPRWTSSAAAAVRHGLPLGAYGVYEPAGVAGAADDAGRAARVRAQAQHFLSVTADAGTTLPPVLDFELAAGPALHNLTAAARWCDTVADAMGRDPILYTGPAFFRGLCRMAGLAAASAVARLRRCPVWLAHYGPALSVGPSVPAPWSEWTLWQYSGDAPRAGEAERPWSRLPGGHGAVDVDFFRGSVAELQALGGVRTP